MPTDKPILTDAELEAIRKHSFGSDTLFRVLDSHDAVSKRVAELEDLLKRIDNDFVHLENTYHNSLWTTGAGYVLYPRVMELRQALAQPAASDKPESEAAVRCFQFPYAVALTMDEEGDVIARIPDLPGCTAHGADVNEALAVLHDVMQAYIAMAKEDPAMQIPAPTVPQEPAAPEAKPQPWDDPSWSPSPPEAKEGFGTGWILGNNYRRRARISKTVGAPHGEPWYEADDGTHWSSYDVTFRPDAPEAKEE